MPLNQRNRRAAIKENKCALILWSRALPGQNPINNDKDTLEGRIPHKMWQNQTGDWEFFFYKNGNEFEREGQDNENPYDMKPVLMHNGQWVQLDESFQHFFTYIDDLFAVQKIDALLHISELLLRNAYMFEHRLINGLLTFSPNPQLIKTITDDVGELLPPTKDGNTIPIEPYLHYLDGIAHNEDVKYHERPWEYEGMTGIHNVLDKGTGRENNQLTLVLYINVVLGRIVIEDGKNLIRELSRKKEFGQLKELIYHNFSQITINQLYPGLFD